MQSRKRTAKSNQFFFGGPVRKNATGVLSAVIALRLREIERNFEDFYTFAEYCDTSVKTIHTLRTGTGNCRLTTLERIARSLDVSIANLLGLDDKFVRLVLKRNGFSGRQKYDWMQKLSAKYLNDLESECGSQKALMQLFPGIGVGTIISLKNGTGSPIVSTFDRLAMLSEVSIWSIFGIEDDEARENLASFGIDLDDVELFVRQMAGRRITMPEFIRRFPEAWIKRRDKKR